jgi:hypothetical protein
MAKSPTKRVVGKKKSAGQSSSRLNQQATQLLRQPFQGWPPNPNSPPPVPGIDTLTVFFHGLLSFCYNPDQHECEVGAYSQSNHHEFKIEVQGGSCTHGTTFYRRDLLPHGRHTLTGGEPPSFYMPALFDRNANPAPDARDFRWMLDIEGSDVYGDLTQGQQSGFYLPKILFSTGEFYTFEKAASKFALVDMLSGDDHYPPIGNMAFCMAAHIDVSGASAVLTLKRANGLPDATCTFSRGGGPHKIFINNDCNDTVGRACMRNDFFHHFGSCSPPAGRHPLMLELVDKQPFSHSCGKRHIDNNDETPCSAAGYGGTPSLP